jgi:hypothetical protein
MQSRAARRGPRWRAAPCGAMVLVLVAHALPGGVAFSCGPALVGLLCAYALSEASSAAFSWFSLKRMRIKFCLQNFPGTIPGEKSPSRLALPAATAVRPPLLRVAAAFSAVCWCNTHTQIDPSPYFPSSCCCAPARACSRLPATVVAREEDNSRHSVIVPPLARSPAPHPTHSPGRAVP